RFRYETSASRAAADAQRETGQQNSRNGLDRRRGTCSPIFLARGATMKMVRVGLLGLLAFSVFAHGVVEPWSEAVLEIGAAVIFLWWGLLFARGSAPVRWHRLFWPMA